MPTVIICPQSILPALSLKLRVVLTSLPTVGLNKCFCKQQNQGGLVSYGSGSRQRAFAWILVPHLPRPTLSLSPARCSQGLSPIYPLSCFTFPKGHHFSHSSVNTEQRICKSDCGELAGRRLWTALELWTKEKFKRASPVSPLYSNLNLKLSCL